MSVCKYANTITQIVPFSENAIPYVYNLFLYLKEHTDNGHKVSKHMECKDVTRTYVDILTLTGKYVQTVIKPEE